MFMIFKTKVKKRFSLKNLISYSSAENLLGNRQFHDNFLTQRTTKKRGQDWEVNSSGFRKHLHGVFTLKKRFFCLTFEFKILIIVRRQMTTLLKFFKISTCHWSTNFTLFLISNRDWPEWLKGVTKFCFLITIFSFLSVNTSYKFPLRFPTIRPFCLLSNSIIFLFVPRDLNNTFWQFLS